MEAVSSAWDNVGYVKNVYNVQQHDTNLSSMLNKVFGNKSMRVWRVFKGLN